MRVAAIGFVKANGTVSVKFLKSRRFSRVGSDFYRVLAVLLVFGWLFYGLIQVWSVFMKEALWL
jgi:hypothetical protein